jgi:hypothetical protein
LVPPWPIRDAIRKYQELVPPVSRVPLHDGTIVPA